MTRIDTDVLCLIRKPFLEEIEKLKLQLQVAGDRILSSQNELEARNKEIETNLLERFFAGQTFAAEDI